MFDRAWVVREFRSPQQGWVGSNCTPRCARHTFMASSSVAIWARATSFVFFLLLQSWATEEHVDHDGTRNRTMKQEAGELAPTKLPSTIPAKKGPGRPTSLIKASP